MLETSCSVTISVSNGLGKVCVKDTRASAGGAGGWDRGDQVCNVTSALSNGHIAEFSLLNCAT